MKIKAAVCFNKGEDLKICEVDLMEPKATDVLVKMVGCGICHADSYAINQGVPIQLPAVFGHEGAGIVEKVGSNVTKVKPGDHIVFCSYNCGECEECLEGMPSCCERCDEVDFGGVYADGGKRLSLDGVELSAFFSQSSFATYAIGDQNNVVKVDPDADLSMLGPLGCGIQTGAGSVLNRLKPPPGSSFVVFGCGGVGLSALMAAKVSSCSIIIAVDIVEKKLELAKELGATHTINALKQNAVEEIIKITRRGADFSIDTTGREETINDALICLKRKGKAAVVASTGDNIIGIKMQPNLMGKSRTLEGIVQGDSNPFTFIPKLIRLNKEGVFPFEKLITYYDFEDVNQALADMHSGKIIKPVLRFKQ